MQLLERWMSLLRRRVTLWGSADGALSAAEVSTYRLGEFGMDDVWVLLPLVFLDPHLQHVSV